MIIVLKEGEVVEQGTHDELMKARGLYYSMWQQQASLEAMSEEEIEMTVLNITGMTVRDVTSNSELTWEGVPEL